MPNITPPKYVRHILITLQSRGCSAYLVGGCVRDMLLGVRPQDWDICTGALPEQVLEIFPDAKPTGLRHGTVTVDRRGVEVTTFRSEGSYQDHRHPDAVSFVGDLTTDLSRRDFTMNAIALSPDGLVVDPFGGAEDIAQRRIRCVGDPGTRFGEDALRMFRALRFSARLGFEVERSTLSAIADKAALAEHLAAERIRDEVEKILLTASPQTVYTAMELGLMDRFLLRRPLSDAGFSRIAQLPKKPLERWAALCILLTRDGCVDDAEEFLLSLRLDSRTVRCCGGCVALAGGGVPDSRLQWKRYLGLFGVDCVTCAALAMDALYGGERARELKSILKSGECFSIKHLAVNGDDLIELGLRGKELGEMLSFLLDYVMEYPDNNRRELLLSLARGTEE